MALYLTVASRNLLQARRRSLLLGGALAAVTALLVLLQSLSNGVTENMRTAALTLMAGHVNVGGFYKTNANDVAPLLLDAAKIRKIVEESTPGLAYVIDRQRGFGKLVSDSGSVFAGISGIDPEQETHLAQMLVLAEESSYKEGGSLERKGDLSKLGQPGSIVLFAGQAKKLGISIGDGVTLTTPTMRGTNNSAEVTVVAICEDIGLLSNWSSFVSKKTVLDLYQLKPETTGAVQIYLTDWQQSGAVMVKLREAFEKAGYQLMEHESKPFFQKMETVMNEDWTGQKLDLTTWDDEVSFLKWVITGLDVITLMLIAVLLVIIAIGIMNTMWIAVRERTGEVGTLRAIGMHRARVLGMFLTEALLLGVASTTFGAIAGALVGLGLDAAQFALPSDAMKAILLSDKLHLSVSAGSLVGAIIGFTLVTGVSALWPALRASRLQPVTAIQAVT